MRALFHGLYAGLGIGRRAVPLLFLLSLVMPAMALDGVLPAGAVVPAQSTASFSGIMNGKAVANGFWWVSTAGSGDAGYMDQSGTYHAPQSMPSTGMVTVGYYYSGVSVTTTAAVVNPVPKPDGVNVTSIHSLQTPLLIHGAGFMQGTTVSVGGVSMPVSVNGATISVQLNLPAAVSGPITLTIANPAPSAAAATMVLQSSFSTTAVTPAASLVHAGTTTQFAVSINGQTPTGGFWWLGGTGNIGWMDNAGNYYPPQTVPANPNITVNYYIYGSSTTTTATLVNPYPKINTLNVNAITQLSTPITVTGSGFLPTSVVTVNGTAVATTYLGYNQLAATASFATAPTGAITIGVTNPDPGGSATSISVTNGLSSTGVTPAATTIHAQGTQQYAITVNAATPTNGYWYVNGSGDVGYMDSTGLYHAPQTVPSANSITVGYYVNGRNYETTGTVTNPVPKPTSVSVSTLTQLVTPLQITGQGFLPTSVVSVNGTAMPTTYINQQLIGSTVTLASATNGAIALTVTNPNPGTSSSAINVTGVFPGLTAVTPSTLASGWVTVQATGTGFTTSTLLMMDGKVMKTTFNSATSLTGVAYLPPWKAQTSTVIAATPQKGSPTNSQVTIPVTNATLSYDVAARFATQAALGPRPDLVEHIQKVGLQGFLTEQLAQPIVTYQPGVLPRYFFLQAGVSGNSLLRQRMSMALSSFVVNQANDQEYQAYAPWEQKLETDAFGNYRALMTDMVSDAKLTDLLNLPGNYATSDTSHPNQNFSREIMQLFTLGTTLLNEDGSMQTDSAGNLLPTYDQNTILDLSRAFTGWNYGPLTNPAFTVYGIDFSQPLQGLDMYHDHGSKTLFGTVTLPAGQDVVTDRNQALDAIFAHPNLPPFVVTRLIEQLVKSNPSPAYIKRVVQVFKNNGKGVRGDLGAVVQAILLDTEARAGDTQAVSATEGFLQDPLQWQLSVMNAAQMTYWDGQAIYLASNLAQNWWYAPSVFGFYPATYTIPGTTLNGPQFSLLNNLTQVHRSQYLYGMLTGASSGFHVDFQANSWLYNAFTTVPDLVDGLNHLLYHGTMPTTTQNAIVNYCSGVSDPNQAFTDAIFLAMNSDAVNVTH